MKSGLIKYFSKMEWRKIAGFEKYEVSNDGQVRKTQYEMQRSGYIATRGGYVMKQQLQIGGYKRVCLSNNVKGYFLVHRLVAIAFIPLVEGKDYVDHINGDKTDNRVENLRWVTASENKLNPNTMQKKIAKSGHRHIRIRDRESPYEVEIQRNRITVYHKCFKTLEEAIAARDENLNIL
jgi:hypothetical protein